MPPFPFDYRQLVPERPLGRFVEALWYARGTVPYAQERIAPTGSTVAVFVLGDPIVETADDGRGESVRTASGFLLGPHDRPVLNAPTGETYAVGIVTTPVGCEAIFGHPPSALRGRVLELPQAWPKARALREGLLAASDPDAMLTDLALALTRELAPAKPGVVRIERALAVLEADPTRPIASLATELGVSHGHLDREFTRLVGLTPRMLARLMRMRRLLARVDVRAGADWTRLAHDLGWFDQAHLIRDFKRHTGVTPSRYLAAQKATFDPEEAGGSAGFVPELDG